MWWIWLVPSIAVVGACLAVAATAVEATRGWRELRGRIEALRTDVTRVNELVAEIEAATAPLRDR